MFVNYLKKAEECCETMKDAFANERWSAAMINAVHCGISSSDALTVFFLGERHAGERHEDCIALFQKTGIDAKILQSKTQQLQQILSVKNRVEYEERVAKRDEAEETIKIAERFYKWVKELLATS
jgi:uncharacterized protein (UPF0332 family)